MPRPANVIHNLVAPLFLERFAHPRGDVVEHFVPSDAFPLPFTAFADALQRIANSLGIANLIERRRAFGAISTSAAGMFRIAFEAPNAMGVLFDKSQQTACRLAVKANRWNDTAMLFDFARPLAGIVLDPIVPFFHRRITC